jgi:hypothetical protein
VQLLLLIVERKCKGFPQLYALHAIAPSQANGDTRYYAKRIAEAAARDLSAGFDCRSGSTRGSRVRALTPERTRSFPSPSQGQLGAGKTAACLNQVLLVFSS